MSLVYWLVWWDACLILKCLKDFLIYFGLLLVPLYCFCFCKHVHVFVVCLYMLVCVLKSSVALCRSGVMYPAVKLVDNWFCGQTLCSLSWPKRCEKVRERGRETEGLHVMRERLKQEWEDRVGWGGVVLWARIWIWWCACYFSYVCCVCIGMCSHLHH